MDPSGGRWTLAAVPVGDAAPESCTSRRENRSRTGPAGDRAGSAQEPVETCSLPATPAMSSSSVSWKLTTASSAYVRKSAWSRL